MEFTGNSKQPWVGWVKGRERQLELLTSIARTRIDGGRNFSGQITVDKRTSRYVQQLGADSSVARFTSQLWRMNALSHRQQEQVQGNSRLERPQLRKLPLSKRELNQSSQLLSDLKSGGTAVQKVISNIVTANPSGFPPFVSCSTTFCTSCYIQPACTESRHTKIESSQPKVQEYAAESLESGHAQFRFELAKSDLQAQGIKKAESLGAESMRALRSGYHPQPVLTLSGVPQADETVVCHSEEILPNWSMKENERPIITWLNGGKEGTVIIKPTKSEIARPRKIKDCNLSSKDFASGSRSCAACHHSLIPQQFHRPEPVHWRIRKHKEWHSHQRDQPPLRKRERTRSGLSCQILGGTSETERQGKPFGGRRAKCEASAGDSRLKAQMKSSQERMQHIRTEKQQKPLVVSLEELLMDLIKHEEGFGQLLPAASGTFELGSNEGSSNPSDESGVEDGLVEAGQWPGRKDEATSPADSLSNCCWADFGTLTTTAQRSPQEVLCGETNDPHGTPDESLIESYDRDEDDEKMNQRVFGITEHRPPEVQWLADKVLDGLLMDLAVEVSSICTSVVDNLIYREFGSLGQ